MIFTSIDDKDPKAPFSFHVKIDDNRKYIGKSVLSLVCFIIFLNGKEGRKCFI